MILNFWLDSLTTEEANSKYFFQHIKEDLTFSPPMHLNFLSPPPPSPPYFQGGKT